MEAIFSRLNREMAEGRDTVLCTIIADNGSAPRGAGAQMLCGKEGLLCGTIGGGAVELDAIEESKKRLAAKQSQVKDYALHPAGALKMVCGGAVTVHFQFIPAGDAPWRDAVTGVLQRLADRESATLLLSLTGGAPALAAPHAEQAGCFPLAVTPGDRAILFGAGHCSAALSPLLQTLGFRVTVMDDRPPLADSARFPGAEQVICGDFARIDDYLTLTEDDFVVVMTSGHRNDFTVEEQVLRRPYAYLGVIGSKSKKEAVNAMLRQAGISDEAIAAVHTPVGLPIGAVTPEEIAVSIAGEMIAFRAARRQDVGIAAHRCPMR